MMSKTFSRNLSLDMQILFVINRSEIITDVIVREVIITKTHACNLQKNILVVKMKIFRGKIMTFFLFLLKT